MYLRKLKKPDGRLYLSIVKGYREQKTKKSRTKTIKSLGYLDELNKEYDDPIAHFTEVAKQMTLEEKQNSTIKITLNKNELMTTDTNDIKNIGFVVLSKLYHKLNIDRFLINRERTINYKYPLNNIMKLLVYSRILKPASKLSTYNNKEMFLEKFNFKQEQMYRSFKILAKYKNDLILDLHENINMLYKRDTTNVFYDVTNYFFHTDKNTELIKKGFGKDRKDKPIIQMGLLLDNNHIPMTYKLFQGNTTDFETLLPILSEVKSEFNLKRTIVVADKGLNSGTNKAYNLIKGDGYIFSRSLRGKKANKDEKKYALDDEGYVWLNDDYKIKSRVYPTDIWITDKFDKKKQVTIDEKHIVFYSRKYDRKAKHNRQKVIEKALKIVNSATMYAKAENYGAMKYIKGMKLDKKTGELTLDKKNSIPVIDDELIKEEEKFDGYYSIVTSELDMNENEVIDRYKELWRIEETFKISKSIIDLRPIRVWTNDSIEAHFLSCFLSLVLIRLLQKETKNLYSIEKMIQSLKEYNVDLLEMNKYKAVYYDEILEHIGKSLCITLDRKYLTLDDIKK